MNINSYTREVSSSSLHPDKALFDNELPVPLRAACEHFAGNEKLIRKAIALQEQMGGVFDITCDCEDGAKIGDEAEHVRMVAGIIGSDENKYNQMGARIHDPSSVHWKNDVDVLVGESGHKIAYITIPKATDSHSARQVIEYIREQSQKAGINREIPVHILVETHGALRDVHKLASLPDVEVLDFGLMDFISAHQGALGFSAMRSPQQFEHELIRRAKSEMVAAALAQGVIPAHNVSLDLKNVDAVYSDASRARSEFGFLRMWSIHPDQIKPIIDAMRPSNEDVAEAEAILVKGHGADWGPISHNGDLHDRATYRYFWSLLRQAKASGVSIGPIANELFFENEGKDEQKNEII